MEGKLMELTNTKTDGTTGTPGRILKVNHAGEFGAINIYRAQIFIGSLYRAKHLPILRDFLAHEKTHLAIFGAELERRSIRRCRSFWLCGIGGFILGLVSAMLGRKGVMACTAAVETVVLVHLEGQLKALLAIEDKEAYQAVEKIVEDEKMHQEQGASEGTNSILYKPFYSAVGLSTEAVIWLGMRL